MAKSDFHLRLLLVVGLLGLPLAACAQVQISAQVDRDVISQDETVDLTVSVTGSGLSLITEPTLPTLSGFRLLGTSTQQSISVVNGTVQTSMNYVYQLQPTRTGSLTIDPVKLTLRGETHRTQPIQVTVTAGSGSGSPGSGGMPMPPGLGPSLFGPGAGVGLEPPAQVKHTVDRKTAYAGEQITYIFSFLQAEQLYGDVQYAPADTPGFVAEDLPNPPQTTERVGDRLYSVQRRMKALFATTPGKHTIGQAGVTATLDPLRGPEDLIADPIAINVLPLPKAGQPAGFSGAVGSFTVRLRVEQPVVRAGETINCVIEVSGSGNVRSLGAPQLTLPDWVRTYKAGENRTVKAGGGGGGANVIGGTASFSYLLLPRQAGTLSIPPVSYSYFDPAARTYRVARSQGATIAVAPGTGAPPPTVPTDNLRPIAERLGRPALPPLPAQVWFWVILILPLLVVAWAGRQRWQQVRLRTAPDQARSASALRLADKRLDMAEKALNEGRTDEFYLLLNEALLDYIADRTAAPPSGLTADLAHDLLVTHGVDPELAAVTRGLVERTAAGRFAPGGTELRKSLQLVVECRQVLSALQRQVRTDG